MDINFFNFKSIKDKVFYFSFLVTLSIILLLIFIAYFITYNNIKNTSISRELDTLELIANQTDLVLNSAESSSTGIIIDSDVQNILTNSSVNNIYPTPKDVLKVQRAIDNSMYKESVISGVILHSTNNFTFQTNSKLISFANYNMEFNKWYGGISNIAGNPYLYTIKQIFNMNTGKLIGYLEVFVDESTLSANYTNTKYNKFINFFLINNDGVITSSSNQNEVSDNIFKLRKNLEFATSNDPIKIIENRKEDKLTLMLYHSNLDWNIVADIYLKDLIKNKEALILSLIILSLIALLLSYVLSKTIAKSIIQPINNLSLAINQVEKGNWSTEIDILSDDEIGLLSKKFNNLIFYIKNLLDTITLEQIKKKEFEFELIQLQIKPHFLYNSLENISALVELERNDEAVDMILNLSTFYRGALSKGNNIISIKDELSLTESYLKIMKLRYYDVFDYEIFSDYNLEQFSCPKLLIQPLVENAIYHGLKNYDDTGKVIICIESFNKELKITIEDTGIGMTEDELQKVITGNISSSAKGGFAVKNTIERLKLFYHNNCIFNIKSQKNIGTTITIVIPAIKKEVYSDEYTFS
ncbi:sensor histidine kinase [Clostridium disporicum]|uniref:Sensor with HAMP domain n=1 Tax=Clostridium disporicum TaxID=84024 RepID=A0A174AVT4_9CLOT|nr:sensor histidine kinase [Clostridium disporicum]CUN92039.1 sensor with HAMP domain [Clostridium disporicum]